MAVIFFISGISIAHCTRISENIKKTNIDIAVDDDKTET